MVALRVAYLLTTSGLVLATTSCGAPSDAGEPRVAKIPGRAEAFTSVTVHEVSMCLDCWREMTVTADGALELEDSEGVETFDLASHEVEEVRSIVASAEFEAALDALACGPVFDGTTALIVHWADVGVQVDPMATHCIGARFEREEHPYGRLYWLVVDLKRKYFPCPPLGTVLPADLPDVDTPPPVRMLCFPCSGEC